MRRELQLLIKERHLIFMLLMGAASAYALLIGNLYAGQIVQNIPVAVCDLDETPLSRDLVRAIADADQVTFTGNLSSEVEAVEVLERGQATAAVIIPKNFARNFYSQRPTEIAFLCDSSNIVQVNYLSTPIEQVAGTFSAQYNQFAALANSTPTLSPMPVSMSQRMSGNSVKGYLEFYIYGIMVMAAQVGITLAFGFSVFEDKKNFALTEQFGAMKILLTKEIFYLAVSIFSVVVGIILLEVLFDMPFRGEIWQLLLICAAFLFAAESLAGVLALIFRTRLAMIQFITFYTLPALLTAGYIWPEVGMTPAIKFLSMIQPVHYALADFRRVALTGLDVTYWQHFGILITVGLAATLIIGLRTRENFLATSN